MAMALIITLYEMPVIYTLLVAAKATPNNVRLLRDNSAENESCSEFSRCVELDRFATPDACVSVQRSVERQRGFITTSFRGRCS
jgi:hypothetical protein